MAIMINDLLLDFKGKTATQRILDDAKKILLENKAKFFGFTPRPNCIALVRTQKKNDNEILSIGGSTPPDLLNDNFLKTLAAIHTPARTNFFKAFTMIDITSTQITYRSYDQFTTGNNDSSGWTNGGLTQIQVGSGSTPAARSDENIETPFVGGAEASRNSISPAGYDSILARVNLSVAIPTTNAGTIQEACLYCNCRTQVIGVNANVLYARDNVSPSVSFLPGETIFVEYVLQI